MLGMKPGIYTRKPN
jgi:hypothetical protein